MSLPQVLRLLVAGWFAVDAVRYAIGAFRRTDGAGRTLAALAALGNTSLALLVVFAPGSAEAWVVAIAGAGRILAADRLEHRHGTGPHDRRCRGHRRA